jgi:hypothetical protein
MTYRPAFYEYGRRSRNFEPSDIFYHSRAMEESAFDWPRSNILDGDYCERAPYGGYTFETQYTTRLPHRSRCNAFDTWPEQRFEHCEERTQPEAYPYAFQGDRIYRFSAQAAAATEEGNLDDTEDRERKEGSGQQSQRPFRGSCSDDYERRRVTEVDPPEGIPSPRCETIHSGTSPSPPPSPFPTTVPEQGPTFTNPFPSPASSTSPRSTPSRTSSVRSPRTPRPSRAAAANMRRAWTQLKRAQGRQQYWLARQKTRLEVQEELLRAGWRQLEEQRNACAEWPGRDQWAGRYRDGDGGCGWWDQGLLDSESD